jgi:hypothetical protein
VKFKKIKPFFLSYSAKKNTHPLPNRLPPPRNSKAGPVAHRRIRLAEEIVAHPRTRLAEEIVAAAGFSPGPPPGSQNSTHHGRMTTKKDPLRRSYNIFLSYLLVFFSFYLINQRVERTVKRLFE